MSFHFSVGSLERPQLPKYVYLVDLYIFSISMLSQLRQRIMVDKFSIKWKSFVGHFVGEFSNLCKDGHFTSWRALFKRAFRHFAGMVYQNFWGVDILCSLDVNLIFNHALNSTVAGTHGFWDTSNFYQKMSPRTIKLVLYHSKVGHLYHNTQKNPSYLAACE